MDRKQVAIVLPETALKDAELLAAVQGVPLAELLTALVTAGIAQEMASYRAAAGKRIRRRLEQGLDLGSGGAVTWDRESLHDR